MSESPEKIDLSCPLRISSAFGFPLQSAIARREVLIGALWLLVPIFGWVLNMGHRIEMVHRMQHGQSAWPAWANKRQLLRDGVITLLGMIEYHAPAVILGGVAWYLGMPLLYIPAALLWIIATMAVPGYMSHYCFARDVSEVFNPFKAMRRVFETGPGYWHAWFIALSALLLSFTGLFVFGLGFLVTSVWFWQVAGYSFATQFTRVFELSESKVQQEK